VICSFYLSYSFVWKGCHFVCKTCKKHSEFSHDKYKVVVPPELANFSNQDGYLKFHIKCFKQAVSLLKLVYSEEDISAQFPNISVGKNIRYAVQINSSGIRLLKKISTSVSREDREIKLLLEALDFQKNPVEKDVLLKCINFVNHPRKVNISSFIIYSCILLIYLYYSILNSLNITGARSY